jgi:hypothetical protein
MHQQKNGFHKQSITIFHRADLLVQSVKMHCYFVSVIASIPITIITIRIKKTQISYINF